MSRSHSLKTYRVAINGFGRIGRKVARLLLEKKSAHWLPIELVAIHDFSPPAHLVHLLKYDSVHGSFPLPVHLENKTLHIGNQIIQLLSERDPTRLPWKSLGIDLVLECSGAYTQREKAVIHLRAGAKKVLISAPAQNPDLTICMGVNESAYLPEKHDILSNASCTTNCLAPVVKVLDDAFGVVSGTMLTVHSYTRDQELLDSNHKDLRRARAAPLSQIPTSTGAAKAVGLVLPHLQGKIDGLAIRVPTPNVSLVDFTCQLRTPNPGDPPSKNISLENIHDAFQMAAKGPLKGILEYSQEPLVSHDYNGSLASATLDSLLTTIVEPHLVKVIAWYDNESGFSARMLDLATHLYKTSFRKNST